MGECTKEMDKSKYLVPKLSPFGMGKWRVEEGTRVERRAGKRGTRVLC